MSKAELVIIATKVDPTKFTSAEGNDRKAYATVAASFVYGCSSWLRTHGIFNASGVQEKPLTMRVFEGQIVPEIRKDGSVVFHLHVIEGGEVELGDLLSCADGECAELVDIRDDDTD